MKHLFTVFVLFACLILNAQDYPYQKPELLLNKEVKIKDLPRYSLKDGYTNFKKDEKGYKTYEELSYNHTKPEALAGRTFKVTNVTGGKISSRMASYILTLQDDKETIYYKYNLPDSNYYFEVIGGLDVTADFYCDYVAEEQAEPGEKMFGMTENKNNIGIMFEKVINIKTKKSHYNIHLMESSVKPAEKGYGVIITLDNGQQINLPKQLVIKDYSSKYFATKTLTPAEVNLLKTHKITGYKLLDQEATVTNEEGWILRGVLQCLQTKQ